jgi:hypothetical protein
MYREIKTVEDAYKATKSSIPEITGTNSELLLSINHLIVISEAIRDGWKPDYNNSSPKWFPWFDLETDNNNPSGFRFDDSTYAHSGTTAVLGPLLCQESSDKSEYMATQFEDVFRKVMK